MIVGIRPAPAAKRTGGCRGAHLIALLASTVLHATLLIALACIVIDGDAIPPEPIVVELVSDAGSGPAGSSAAGGQQAPAAGTGEGRSDAAERLSVEARDSVEGTATETARGPDSPLPRPRTVAKRPRLEPKKVPPSHPYQQPSALGAEPTTPTTDAVSPSDTRTQPDGPLVASLGTGGAATAVSGGTGRPGGRLGAGTGDDGSTRGPGFSLGSVGNPMPRYPPAARRRGIEGKVVLDVLVSAEGRALSVAIARSSGSSLLDEAARETIGRWRFRPAMRREEAIEARATVPVQFSLVEP